MLDISNTERLFRVNWQIPFHSSGTLVFAVSSDIPEGKEEDLLRAAIRRHYRENKKDHVPSWTDAANEVNFEGTGFRLLNMAPCNSIEVDNDEVI